MAEPVPDEQVYLAAAQAFAVWIGYRSRLDQMAVTWVADPKFRAGVDAAFAAGVAAERQRAQNAILAAAEDAEECALGNGVALMYVRGMRHAASAAAAVPEGDTDHG